MNIFNDIAAGVTRYLARELELNARDAETIRFGLESLLGTLLNIAVTVLLGWWLEITPQVLAVLMTVVIMRHLSGGVHSSTPLRCLVLGTAILVGIAQLTALIGAKISQNLLFLLVAVTVAGGFYAVYKWAPADTPAKPIVSPAKRAGFRRLSYLYLALWAVVVSGLILRGGAEPLFLALALASMGGLWWQLFSITPAGYRFVGILEMSLDAILLTGNNLFRQE